MKTSYLIIPFLVLLSHFTLRAQDVNFRALDDTKHLISAHVGVDYGSYMGLSYGYVLKTKYTPLIIGTEFSIPFGGTVLDDWKWKTSVQAEVWKRGNFSVTVKPSVIFRRYESNLATMYNIGGDLTVNIGYVTPKWGVVGVANFDKAIVTHLEHDLLKEYYPDIKDGWYLPTGGNFKFGARAHYSFGTWNTFLTVGKQFGQNFEDNPTLPFFAELSVQKRLATF